MKVEQGQTRLNTVYLGAARGFTLVELLTVIAIAVILMAITVPVGRSLRDGNRMMACASALHAIHQALKMYWLDERAVPPPYDPAYLPNPGEHPRDSHGGLYRLYATGYLSKEVTLHCPAHARDPQTMRNVTSKDLEYYHSYDGLDPDAKVANGNPIGVLARFTYMPYRGEADQGSPDYHRQLAAPDLNDPGRAAYLPTWTIDDSAVVCWCPHHARSVKRGGEPAYHVLFWGGEVLVKGESVMHGDAGPAETWRVRPED